MISNRAATSHSPVQEDPLTKLLKEAHERLSQTFPVIQNEIREEQADLPKEDVLTMQLNLIISEADQLETKVSEFLGPHFTKPYRTMQGDFEKLQIELDRLDVDRHDLRDQRKSTIIRIESLAKALAGMTHADGKSCPECEVKN